MKYALLIYSSAQDQMTFPKTSSSRSSVSTTRSPLNPLFSTGCSFSFPESATTVRVQNGEALLSDGPFVDAKEYIGGFFLLEVDNLDEATALAARVPAARMGGAVEVRPIVER